MATYYLSNSGCDENNGLSPETPIKTIGKLNSIINGGDTAKFKCSDTFYGIIMPPKNASPDAPTTYTCYSEGAKPIVSQYKKPYNNSWEDIGNNVWRLDLKDTAKFTGNTLNLDTNVGFIKVSGIIHAKNAFTHERLANDWDFYSDDQYLYVKLSACPDTISDDICIACNTHHMCFADNIKVDSITFCGGGGHGIAGVANGAHINNCEFHEIGGSVLDHNPPNSVRYGNGVECWTDSCNVLVENCRFSNIYDVAVTMQGGGAQKGWRNITFKNNVIWNCQQSFEIWSQGDVPDIGFINCSFENNVCINSGYGWSNDVRPDYLTASHLLIYGLECPICDVKVVNNTFYRARLSQIFKAGGIKCLPDDYVIKNNTFITDKSLSFANDDVNDEFYQKIKKQNTVIYSGDYPKIDDILN